MSTEQQEHSSHLPTLEKSGWDSWRRSIYALLREKDLFETAQSQFPDIDSPTPVQVNTWYRKTSKAAGIIFKYIGSADVHLVDPLHDDNAFLMMEDLRKAKADQVSSNRFNAYMQVLSIKKGEDSTYQSVLHDVVKAVRHMKELRPTGFSLTDMDADLAVVASMAALDPNDPVYIHLSSDPDLNLAKVKTAYQVRDNTFERSPETANAVRAASTHRQTTTTAHKELKAGTIQPCLLHPTALKPHSTHDCFAVRKLVNEFKERNKNQPKKMDNKGKSKDSAKLIEEDSFDFGGMASTISHISSPHPSDNLVVDSGATCHMTPNRQWLHNFRPMKREVKLADGGSIWAKGAGDILFRPTLYGKPANPVWLKDALFIPELSTTLISMGLCCRNGGKATIENEKVSIFDSKGVQIMKALTISKLPNLIGTPIKINNEKALTSRTTSSPISQKVWHFRFGHRNHRDMLKMEKQQLVKGLVIAGPKDPSTHCDACVEGKMTRVDVPKSSSSITTRPLELIHSDLKGPWSVKTAEGYQYWISFIDDYSRYCSGYLLKRKSDAFTAWKSFVAKVENATSKKILRLRDDKGGEYSSLAWSNHTDSKGIWREHTATDTPHQNGVAERFNRTAAESVLSTLQGMKAPKSQWGNAFLCYLKAHNTFLTSPIKKATPFELFFQRKPEVQQLRVFWSKAHVWVRKRGQLDPKAIQCRFIGYEPGVKAWRFEDCKTRKKIVSQHAIFYEAQSIINPSSSPILRTSSNNDGQSNWKGEEREDDSDEGEEPVEEGDRGEEPPPEGVGNDGEAVREPEEEAAPPRAYTPPPAPPPAQPPQAPRRARIQDAAPRRSRRLQELPPEEAGTFEAPGNYWEAANGAELLNELDDCRTQLIEAIHDDPGEVALAMKSRACLPQSYKEAIQGPQGRYWQEAMVEEYQALIQNQTWTLSDLPAGRKPIGGRWVYAIKYKADGSIERFKARWVAKGFSQRPGYDFVHTYAPTVMASTVRTVLALVATEDLEFDIVDITAAYLNGDLDEDVYMIQPTGFTSNDASRVCKLKKAIYGLKQAGRQWWKTLRSFLLGLGFRISKVDACLYLFTKGKDKLWIPVHVDDQGLASNSRRLLDWVKDALQKKFKIRDLGPATTFLGIQITRDRPNRKLYLSQHRYIDDLLDRFNMGNANSHNYVTPLDPGCKLTPATEPATYEESAEMAQIPYREAVGGLQWASITTRPDIAYATGVLGQFTQDPRPQHWKAVQHVLRYLKGTRRWRLAYGRSTDGIPLKQYGDASYAGDYDRKSINGGATFIGNCLVAWHSKRQSTVATSTAAAEYYAAHAAGREALATRHILSELGYAHTGPTPLYCDNQATCKITCDPKHDSRLKHVDVLWHWLREQVDYQNLSIHYIPTQQMVADIFTKSLSADKHITLCKALGLQE
jgi:hypothetical protein